MPKFSMSRPASTERFYTQAEFGEFAEAYHGQIRRMANKLGIYNEDAEDASQFILMKIYIGRYLDRFDPNKAKFNTFAYLTINGWLHRFRQHLMASPAGLTDLPKMEPDSRCITCRKEGDPICTHDVRRSPRTTRPIPVNVMSVDAKADDPKVGDYTLQRLGLITRDRDYVDPEAGPVQDALLETYRDLQAGDVGLARMLRDVLTDLDEHGDIQFPRIAARRKIEDRTFSIGSAKRQFDALLQAPAMGRLRAALLQSVA